MGSGAGSLRITAEVSSAQYLLLHEAGSIAVGLFKIKDGGPRIFSKEDLLASGYPSKPNKNFYIVFDIEPASGFEAYQWHYAAISEQPAGYQLGSPYTTTLTKVMQASTVKPLFSGRNQHLS
jgi:hypothetical protein